MRELSAKFKINIVGGDTNRSKKIIVNIALLGEVEKKCLVLRSGAKVGDIIFVSGTLGGSLKEKHLTFLPRIKEARHLVKNYKLNSMIDLSDGLSSDLNQIAKASNVGAIIYEELIPISKQAHSLEAALNDGEDFELLFSLSLNEARRLSSSWKMKVPLVQIGEIVKKNLGLRIITKAGREKQLVPNGFRHF
jgi:thiamine-monophosphate kinase